MRRRSVLLLLTCVLAISACTTPASTPSTAEATAPSQKAGTPTCPDEGQELDTAKIYIEHNATDADTGVHGLFGGMAWRELCIWDPSGQLILVVGPRGPLGDLAIADLFFESREPPNDEYTLDMLRADFPEGDYQVGGTDFEGVARVAVATFTHNIPQEPIITSPEIAEDEEAAAETFVDPNGMVVRWDPVTETVTGDPVTLTGYQVIMTKVDHDDPNGWSRPIYDVHVGADVTSLAVPREFVEVGILYELEVLALEISGNQTIGLGFFTTEGSGAEALEYEDSTTFIEYNAGNDDLGFHIEFGGEPWTSTTITGPNGELIFDLTGGGSVLTQGFASIFGESGEYPVAELTREQFFARFPEGEYTFTGRAVDGATLKGTWDFSHLIPDPPSVISPAERATVDVGDVTVSWEPVTSPGGVEVEVYQLQVYPVDPPEGLDPIDLSIDYTLEVPADVRTITIPGGILEAGAEYEFELTVVDANLNRSFTIGHFTTS